MPAGFVSKLLGCLPDGSTAYLSMDEEGVKTVHVSCPQGMDRATVVTAVYACAFAHGIPFIGDQHFTLSNGIVVGARFEILTGRQVWSRLCRRLPEEAGSGLFILFASFLALGVYFAVSQFMV